MALSQLSRVVFCIVGMGILLMAGCSGSHSSDQGPLAKIDKIYVVGDSLSDVGTFGYKFTIQNSNDAKTYLIWPQLVANSFGFTGGDQCNFYTYESSSFRVNSARGCTNFAIGGSKIFDSTRDGGASNTPSISTQLAQKIATLGNYAQTDLVLIEGGGNDIAALIDAQLSGTETFQILLAQQLESATITDLLAQDATGSSAANLYMRTLASNFFQQIKKQTLEKGATHVAILNIPDITLTPRFQTTSLLVKAAQGVAVAQALQTSIRAWTDAYNAKLKELIGNDSRIVLIDFNTSFTEGLTHASVYSLSNVQDAACPAVGFSSGLPQYNLAICSDTSLDAMPGKAAGWWKSYAFSDDFHPSPYGHQLIAISISRSLARAGWL